MILKKILFVLFLCSLTPIDSFAQNLQPNRPERPAFPFEVDDLVIVSIPLDTPATLSKGAADRLPSGQSLFTFYEQSPMSLDLYLYKGNGLWLWHRLNIASVMFGIVDAIAPASTYFQTNIETEFGNLLCSGYFKDKNAPVLPVSPNESAGLDPSDGYQRFINRLRADVSYPNVPDLVSQHCQDLQSSISRYLGEIQIMPTLALSNGTYQRLSRSRESKDTALLEMVLDYDRLIKAFFDKIGLPPRRVFLGKSSPTPTCEQNTSRRALFPIPLPNLSLNGSLWRLPEFPPWFYHNAVAIEPVISPQVLEQVKTASWGAATIYMTYHVIKDYRLWLALLRLAFIL